MAIRVVRHQQESVQHKIHIGRHNLASDVNVEEGGRGSGPNPHDLYDAALGACTALTVLWYAKRKNIRVPLKVAPLRQCFWFGPTSSSSRERNSLRTVELFALL
jgi:hypothetical protein